MADKKVTELTALGAAPATTDILLIVDDPGGTPITKKVTVANLLAALDKTAGNLDDYDFDDNPIFGYSASTVAKTANYTLTDAENGKVITFNSGSNVNCVVDNGLTAGFNCTVIQLGAGQVIFDTGTATVNNSSGHDRSAGQYAVCSLIHYSTNNYALCGDTTAA